MIITDKERIDRIEAICNQLIDFVQENKITEDEICSNKTLQWTLTTLLYNIGENVYALTSEFKDIHSSIPWNRISGLRHRLVHDYEDTNWTIISKVVLNDIPEFLDMLNSLE